LNQREGETWRDQIYFLTHRLITGAKAMGYEVINDNYFPIVCVVIGKTREVIEACQILWDYGILITPALYPIVPKERGLLRFSITAANTLEEIDRSLAALAATSVPPLSLSRLALTSFRCLASHFSSHFCALARRASRLPMRVDMATSAKYTKKTRR
jgi:hypothetical protein